LGIMTCIVLERLLSQFPDLLSHFDFIAGTSNGSMIAMGLAFGFHPSSCRALLEVTAETVLSKVGLRGSFDFAKFTNQYLKLFCDESWGTRRLCDANKFILVPAFLLDDKHPEKAQRSWRNRLYHNLLQDDAVANELAADVVMRSSAAPTYFPSFQGHVDGGMFAHDPASISLILAMTKLRKAPTDIRLLSFGTGHVQHLIEGEQHDWGMVQWVGHMPTLLWDGMIQQSETICSELLGDGYHRMNPLLETEVSLDEHKQIPIMTKIGQGVDIVAAVKWIKENIYKT